MRVDDLGKGEYTVNSRTQPAFGEICRYESFRLGPQDRVIEEFVNGVTADGEPFLKSCK